MKVGCFGKLPISPEFIRVNASGEGVKAFDQWLQEGIQYARTKQRDWSKDFLKMDTWNFLVASPENHELLIGTLSPNQDRAGRTFPFLVFISIEKKEFTKPLHFVPMIFGEFLRQARETAEQGWQHNDLPTFRMGIQNIERPEVTDQQEAYETYLHNHSAHQFFDELFDEHTSPTTESTRERLRRHVVDLSENVGATTGSSIRIPLQSREPLCEFDVVFWVEVLSRLRNHANSQDMFFWVHEPKFSKPYLFMTTLPASPKAFLSLIQASRQHQTSMVDEGVEHSNLVGEDKSMSGISLTTIRNALAVEMPV